MGLKREVTRHALGIAEYHGPRSQMMRCIDHPTMLKDGSGWGAMVGVSAGMLAAQGFTGAPAVTVESEEVAEFWADIGERWYLIDQDFKRHAVCHWAQPPIAGAVGLMHKHGISPQDISRVRIFTFHEATRLTCCRPKSTEEAQYSLPFPVAAAIIHGRLGPDELSGEGLTDPRVMNIVDLIEMQEDDECNALFPKVQVARVKIETTGGEVFESDLVPSPWDIPYTPESMTPSDQALGEKFQWLASGSMSESRTEQLEARIWSCEELGDSNSLNDLLYTP
jgi:2-methylcitrate dehydratase PrpD